MDIELDYTFTLKPILPQEFGLSNLEMLETLSVSSLGRIRLVRCLDDEKYYQLKMLKKSKVIEFKQMRNLINEVGILSRLRCCFVPEIKAVFQDENSVFIMSEYVAGGELFSHLRKAVYFDEVVIQFYATEIACAISYLHALNITYRGLKPESIQINQKGHITTTTPPSLLSPLHPLPLSTISSLTPFLLLFSHPFSSSLLLPFTCLGHIRLSDFGFPLTLLSFPLLSPYFFSSPTPSLILSSPPPPSLVQVTYVSVTSALRKNSPKVVVPSPSVVLPNMSRRRY